MSKFERLNETTPEKYPSILFLCKNIFGNQKGYLFKELSQKPQPQQNTVRRTQNKSTFLTPT